MAAPNNNLTPTLREVIDGAIEERLLSVRTAMEAVVESYDAEKQLVDARPEIKLPFIDAAGVIQWKPAPTITSCPVAFPGGGGFRMVFPCPKGTTGLLIFSQSPIDDWMEQGGDTTPTDTRQHALTDAIFFPMLRPKSAAFTDADAEAISMGKDGGPQVVVTKDEVQLGGNPSDPPTDAVALAPATKRELQKLADAMKAGFDTIKANDKLVAAHTHEVAEAATLPADSLSSMQDPSDPEDPGDVAATKTKAK
jgi:hypothetical protein